MCCASSCGNICGGDGCHLLPGGASACCTGTVSSDNGVCTNPYDDKCNIPAADPVPSYKTTIGDFMCSTCGIGKYVNTITATTQVQVNATASGGGSSSSSPSPYPTTNVPTTTNGPTSGPPQGGGPPPPEARRTLVQATTTYGSNGYDPTQDQCEPCGVGYVNDVRRYGYFSILFL